MRMWAASWRRFSWFRAGFGVVLVGLCAGVAADPSAQVSRLTSRFDGYIGGTVESANGKEPGVWVIAETTDLPTKLIKIVVTDDQGRFVLPQMPRASYNVWVRGYGLADSKPVKASVGTTNLALKAVVARDAREAAQVYPANYWYSLLEVPAKEQFPGTGPTGNGIAPAFANQAQFVDQLKQGCQLCHQLGNQITREVGHMDLAKLGLKDSFAAWDHRLQTGQRGGEMSSMATRMGRKAVVGMYARWTDAIAGGAVPEAPPRPKGVERNIVVTMWDWGNATSYMHDEITTAKAKPTVNANGPVYAVDAAHGKVIVVDPLENRASEIPIPTRDDPKAMRSRFPQKQPVPSLHWGDQIVHAGVADPHNPMMDTKGRLWTTSTVRQGAPLPFCTDGSLNKYAAYFPLPGGSGRHASFYDPRTAKWELIYTCFGTHHLQFGTDPNETVYFSGGGQTIPWVDSKVYDETKDEVKAQGWCPTVLDTNGDGKITKPWNEPVGGGRAQGEGGGGGQLGEFDLKRDTRVNYGSYGVIVSPTDQSIWTSGTSFPGRLVRLERGNNPPETCKSEFYTIPTPELSFGPRGIDVDRNGVIWAAISGSGGFVSFDRRKCKGPLNGPGIINGDHCKEGWAIYPLTAGPNMKGTPYNADFHYYNWVDQFNTSGLGENLPIANGSGSDSLLVLKPQTKEWLVLRVPYPMGFYTRGLDGRIDDPKAGWKGRGLWANYGTNFLWHTEGGKGTTSKMVKFQVRPDPLAR
ncbi:MAG: carboxypeptidase regulatory-like domain-containing protein [Gammaproteobacteria bacterium]|nr:carboxypeptidase regulatory-like domain-containing protein [Gammaproteobacteria bacterium]